MRLFCLISNMKSEHYIRHPVTGIKIRKDWYVKNISKPISSRFENGYVINPVTGIKTDRKYYDENVRGRSHEDDSFERFEVLREITIHKDKYRWISVAVCYFGYLETPITLIKMYTRRRRFDATEHSNWWNSESGISLKGLSTEKIANIAEAAEILRREFPGVDDDIVG